MASGGYCGAAAVALLLGAITASGCHEPVASAPAVRPEASRTPVAASDEPLQAVGPPPAIAPGKVKIGARLFFDRRLSRDRSVSCSTCHNLTQGGADGRAVAIGVGGRLGLVNTPTVFNADLNVKQFWDGRADTLESQIDGPILNPREMGATWADLLAELEKDPGYRGDFSRAYADGISIANVKDAIASYERTLVTLDAPFDRYLAGDRAALSAVELRGYELFKSYGCVSCHEGQNVGGNLFQYLGILGNYFTDRGGPVTEADLGRFNVTKLPEDRFKFRVPGLRMVSRTAPYFHDGRVATLQRAIIFMGKYQLGKQIPPEDAEDIAAFLGSLAGRYLPPVPFAAR